MPLRYLKQVDLNGKIKFCDKTKNMEIEIQLYAFLKHYLPDESSDFTCKIQIPNSISVYHALKKLKIPDEVIERIMIIMINGVHAKKEQILSDGDILTVVPFAAGG